MAKKKMYQRPDGLYEKKITIDGKRVVFRGRSEREVIQKIAVYQQEKSAGPLFATVADDWWEDVQTRVRYGTIRCYKSSYDRAKEWFSGERIASIESHQINSLLLHMKQQGNRKNTIANQKTVLSQIFAFWCASPQYKGDKNPVLLVSLPANLSSRERMPPPEEYVKLVDEHPEGFGIAAWTFKYTGVRLGEANGLQYCDIDFKGEKIKVDKAYPWKHNKPYLEATKSAKGDRTVPLLNKYAAMLAPLAKQHKPTDFILSGTSTPLTQSQYNRRWATYCRELGMAQAIKRKAKKKRANGQEYECEVTDWLPLVTAHQWRHEFASALYEAGVPDLEAQTILGHADIATTKKIYTHVRTRQLKAAQNALNKYFDEPKSTEKAQ